MEGARRAYEELLSSGFEANDTTLSNMVVATSWHNVEEMKRFGSAQNPGCCTVSRPRFEDATGLSHLPATMPPPDFKNIGRG